MDKNFLSFKEEEFSVAFGCVKCWLQVAVQKQQLNRILCPQALWQMTILNAYIVLSAGWSIVQYM